MDAWGRFQGRRIDSGYLRWAFCPVKHGWKSCLTLNSFPAHIRDFKNLKGIWHQMLARSHQLQSIFRLLKPFLPVQIWCQSVAVFQNHGVVSQDQTDPKFQDAVVRVQLHSAWAAAAAVPSCLNSYTAQCITIYPARAHTHPALFGKNP